MFCAGQRNAIFATTSIERIVDVSGTYTVNAPPTIISNGGGDTAALSLAENTTAVTTVTATDRSPGVAAHRIIERRVAAIADRTAKLATVGITEDLPLLSQ